MRVFTALPRAALWGASLAVLLALTGAAAYAEGLVPLMIGDGGASPWVKVCDRGQVTGKAKDGKPIAGKPFETCTTLTEQIRPDTGKVMLNAALEYTKLGGKEMQALRVTLPPGVRQAGGAAVAVLPADLWQKVQRNEKLDTSDESRLETGTVTLPIKLCLPAGCVAFAEAAPKLIDMLKDGAGLMVRTVRASGTPESQPVSLGGFAKALAGPPMDTTAYKEARERLLKEIAARQKRKRQEPLK